MIQILCLILFLIFISLGMIHLYWLLGGRWGLEKVIPTKSKNEKFQAPPKIATFGVAIILFIFGGLYLSKSGLIDVSMIKLIPNYCFWIIPFVFLLRAIGEFKYVGFFKKIKNTEFAKADSKYFSPLCLFIALIGIVTQVL